MMGSSWKDHFLPLLIRALLILLGAGALLQDRMELASPLSSMAAIREALAQLRLGAAGQPGGSAQLSPLLAPLALNAHHPLLMALPNLAADGISAWLLSGLAGPFAGQAYLWSPFALLACLAGSTAPLHNALAIAAAWAAATGRPVLAGMALACSAQLSFHTALFAVPLLLLLWRGAQQLPGSKRPQSSGQAGAAGGETDAPPAAAASAAALESSKGGLGHQARAQAAAGSKAGSKEPRSEGSLGRECSCDASGSSGATVQQQQEEDRGSLLRCATFLLSLAAASLVWLAAEGAVAAWVGAGRAGYAVQGSARGDRLGWVRREAEGNAGVAPQGLLFWFLRRLQFAAEVEDLRPNLGLAWYFFAESFPKFRGFFLYCFHAISASMAVPLALRFPRQPLLCLLAQALTNCLLNPYPTYGDIALWLGLLPVAALLLLTVRGKGWWCLSFLVVLGLNTATYQLWWVRGIANANFFYGMNLAWAAWQVFFLLQLLKAAVRLEGLEGQGKEGKEEEGRGGKEELSEEAGGGGTEKGGAAGQQRQQEQKQLEGEAGVGQAVASGALEGSAAVETAAAAAAAGVRSTQ